MHTIQRSNRQTRYAIIRKLFYQYFITFTKEMLEMTNAKQQSIT